jgi:hypothetical protein
MRSKILSGSLILTLASLSSCASVLPEMEKPISLFKGVPSVSSICKKAVPEIKTEAVAKLPSIPASAVGEWVDRNISGVTAKCLPTNSKEFAKYIALSAEDYGVLLKFINDLKRKVAGD